MGVQHEVLRLLVLGLVFSDALALHLSCVSPTFSPSHLCEHCTFGLKFTVGKKKRLMHQAHLCEYSHPPASRDKPLSNE